LISVDTLEALAHQVPSGSSCIIPMLDARRMEVYAAVYDQDHQQIRTIEAQILEADSFIEFLNIGRVSFIGNGVDKTKGIITHPNAIFIEDKLPSANEMGKL